MSQGAEQVRLAIGVFDDPDNLWRTVRALMDDGFSLEQFCLVGLASTVADIGRTGYAPAFQPGLFSQVEAWPGTGDGHAIVATSGPLLNSLLSPQAPGTDSGNQSRMFTEHTSEILVQVLKGTIVLVIRSLTPAQQRSSTRTLLDQSSHSVKTYDFMVHGAAAGTREVASIRDGQEGSK